MNWIQQEQRTIDRQDAFSALLESLRREAPAPKPMAVAGLDVEDETPAESEQVEIPCQDCGGTSGDGSALEGWEPCPYCKGSGIEAPLAHELLPPGTVPALVGIGQPIAGRCVASIGPNIFVRTGRRA